MVKELLRLFEEKPELGHGVKMMWTRDASAQEVAGMLSSKGATADAAQVEELLAAMRTRRAETIGKGEKVDTDQLRRIAGG